MPHLLPQLLKLGVYFFTDFKHESLMFEGALGQELMYMTLCNVGNNETTERVVPELVPLFVELERN